jgi:hypothetical protein
MKAPSASYRSKSRKSTGLAALVSMVEEAPPQPPQPLVEAADGVPATAVFSKKTPRSRRPKIVYSDRVVTCCTSDDENVILKLTFEDTGASGQTPDPYDKLDGDTFALNPCSLSVTQVMADDATTRDDSDSLHMPHMPHMRLFSMSGSDIEPSKAAPLPLPVANQTVGATGCRAPGLKVVRLLTEFEEKNKNSEWPSSTSVHCYWCCHRFSNVPVGLPVKFANDRFHVVGCFCSLECACAYNFTSHDSIDECLNRYTLVNALSNRLGFGRTVQPAPDRLALSIFGGHLEIDEFRAFSSATKRHVIVNSPPMLTVTQQVEEVNDTDMRSEYRYIPLDSERINRYQEKVRLKRCKPLVNFKNTLDHTMKLKYV